MLRFDDATDAEPSPFVEVELVYKTSPERGAAQDGRWSAFEVWTENRVYACDWSMTCIAVQDRATHTWREEHRLIGARLSGGQREHGGEMEISYPCPRPGDQAVFQTRDGRGYASTTKVSRVVLRVRVLHIPGSELQPTFDDLTGSKRLARRP